MTQNGAMPIGRIVAQAPAGAPPAGAPAAGAPVPGAPAGVPGAPVATATAQQIQNKIGTNFDTNLAKEIAALGATPSVDDTAIAMLRALNTSTVQAAQNATELQTKGDTTGATLAMQSQQALTRFMQDIQGLFMDQKILPFKLLSAFGRGIGLTTIS